MLGKKTGKALKGLRAGYFLCRLGKEENGRTESKSENLFSERAFLCFERSKKSETAGFIFSRTVK